MTATITPRSWAEFIRREYLADFVQEGGAAIKFGVPLEEPARAATRNALDEVARGCGFIVVNVDAAETRVNSIDRLFFRIADQIDWPGFAERVMHRLCEQRGYKKPDASERPFYESAAEKNGISPELFRMDLLPAINDEVFTRGELTKDFRVAMTQLCRAHLSGREECAAIVRAMTEWLTGTNRRVGAVKPYLIFNAVRRTNARHLLESLFRWVKIAGFPGTLVIIDVARLALARNPHDDRPYYTPANLLDAFEVLREFIDSTDRLAHCLIVVLP